MAMALAVLKSRHSEI